jgi:cytochrome bd-type quinol oxidase subunit 2
MIIQLFGYFLAAAALFTSIAMALMGARWQAVEQSAYAGERRPWWFVLISILLVGLYLAALVSFIDMSEKSWAGWFLMVFIPIGWGLKGTLIIFNPKGRQTVSAIEGDQNWRKIALARLPIAILLAVLTYFA